jgi:hypothetical protein
VNDKKLPADGSDRFRGKRQITPADLKKQRRIYDAWQNRSHLVNLRVGHTQEIAEAHYLQETPADLQQAVEPNAAWESLKNDTP